MGIAHRQTIVVRLPEWVPTAARNYLVHTETGISIRAIARATECHPSTVLRQVRRFENRRDDPLIDDILQALSKHVPQQKESDQMDPTVPQHIELQMVPPSGSEPDLDANFEKEATRVLRRLCESGAVLAAAREMDMAVVVRDFGDGSTTRTAVVSKDIARGIALREWISCNDSNARIARYHITNLGRTELKRMMAQAENRALGFSEGRADFSHATADWDRAGIDLDPRGYRQVIAESPLLGLSRRRDRDGRPFLSRELVAVGERLREDFELAQMGPHTTQNWESFLTGPMPRRSAGAGAESGSAAAKERVKAALRELAPGLGDVVLRTCCFLEGLEQAEKNLGWAARSGKIVLRIALMRLKLHYEQTQGKFGPKIG